VGRRVCFLGSQSRSRNRILIWSCQIPSHAIRSSGNADQPPGSARRPFTGTVVEPPELAEKRYFCPAGVREGARGAGVGEPGDRHQ
jgi:hypothetical protein